MQRLISQTEQLCDPLRSQIFADFLNRILLASHFRAYYATVVYTLSGLDGKTRDWVVPAQIYGY